MAVSQINITFNTLFFAFVGGLLPALIWLFFWLREDKKRPEPREVLTLTFFAGATSALAAIVLEKFTLWLIQSALPYKALAGGLALTLLSWAFIEEILKYGAAYLAALRKKSFDEPIDALIYLITAGLGFAALENILFLISSFGLDYMSGIIVSNLRFIGATLLHSATSGIVGASIGFSFFHREKLKRNVIGGIFIASILHFAFNYLIINNAGKGAGILKIFIPLWITIIILIFIFEKVKRIKK